MSIAVVTNQLGNDDLALEYVYQAPCHRDGGVGGIFEFLAFLRRILFKNYL